MSRAFICDAVRTPIGRFGGALAGMRPDDLAAHTIRELMSRNASVDWGRTDDVLMGCANQAGEDNRNVARMALLLAGMSTDVLIDSHFASLDRRPIPINSTSEVFPR